MRDSQTNMALTAGTWISMMRNARIHLVLLAVGVTGCASRNYQTALGPSTHVNSAKSYLYGRFALDKEVLLATRLALELNNVKTGEHLSIKFKSSDDVFPIEVPPGDYQLTGLILAKAGPNLEFVGDYKRTPLAFSNELSKLTEPFSVEAGKAFYLGDYFGSLGRNCAAMPPAVGFTGNLQKVLLEYEATTAELKKRYPQFQSIETRPTWKRE